MLRNLFCQKLRWLLILLCLCIGFASLQSGAVQQAAAQTVNPTPIIISLTPQATATPTLGHDDYEPNNEPSQASGVGAQTIAELTLPAGDIDYFALLLPAGHTVTAETIVQSSLDTQLTLWVNGQLVASNDNKGGGDAGSRVVHTATGDVTIILLVEPLADTSGRYDLQLSLLPPTATPQPPATATLEPTPTQLILPTATQPPPATATPIPTNTPLPPPPTATMIVWPTATSQPIWPTATPQPVWPTHTPTAQTLAAAPTVPTATPLPASGGSAASSEPVALIPLSPTVTAAVSVMAVSVTAVPTSPLDVETTPEVTSALEVTPTLAVSTTLIVSTAVPTTTVALSTTGVVTTAVGPALTLERIGRIPTPTPEAATYIRLLIYYDANNDRAPGPTEGISNVSVLAVNDHGQQLAHLFTNRQGEAVFTLTSADASRLIVPFVPSWSARIQPNQHNDTVVLGLPAVRLPVFLPVQPAAEPDRPR